MAMPVGVRRRYFLDIPRHQAERNLNLAGVILLPHAGQAGQQMMARWQITARWVKDQVSATRDGIRQLRALVARYSRVKVTRGDDDG